ncbi:hypothetical protein ACP179_18250 [Xenorhabdus stockiae]|uniref:hypothetical protein n=1 Tax=Xenorhabdus stockiae TaxID=351614 RepID=UPI003CF21E47
MKQRARTQTPKRAHRSLRIPIELDEYLIHIAHQQNQSYSAVLCAVLRYVFDEKGAVTLPVRSDIAVIARYPFLARYLEKTPKRQEF